MQKPVIYPNYNKKTGNFVTSNSNLGMVGEIVRNYENNFIYKSDF